ncbi:MAG: MotA/TolQ/ExbB proton channel family protein [Phycisphaeraceae bacterium]|nr:MAG: MotA/TolQ/ExbB proton channel family protein [Phycisphaeraceae bacterium]
MHPILTTLAQTTSPPTGDLWGLFTQSFDAFTVMLITGSLYAAAVIVRNALDVRPKAILPQRELERAASLVEHARWGELREFVKTESTFIGAVLRPAIAEAHRGREAMEDAAEMAASSETARWFRKIEPLNIVGNLGPLVGLAGTVWGMILAFTSLGATGGQAGPTELSEGISKALFHTLLGLLLAIPCLLVFGFYRSMIDRLCTRAITETARLVGHIPAGDECPDALISEKHRERRGAASAKRPGAPSAA